MNEKIIIDGHAHACGEYLTAEKIIQKITASNVDMILLTPGQYNSKITYGLKRLAEKNPTDDVVSKNNRITSFAISLIRAINQIPKGNEYVYQLKCAIPKQIKQCYWVTKSNYNNIEHDYERMNFDAIKFHQCWEKFDIDSDFFIKTVEWATRMKLPVFLHIRNLEQVKKIINFIYNHQDTIIIIGHLYGMELFLKEEKKVFKNTYFDLSNMYFVSKERTMIAYHHFGSQHLLMGSDTPYGKHALEYTIEQISNLGISKEEKEQILGGNLAKILKK